MPKFSRRELLLLTPALVISGLLGMRIAHSTRENALRSQCRGRLAELGRAFVLCASASWWCELLVGRWCGPLA